MQRSDPYVVRESDVLAPPVRPIEIARRLGPGLIVTGSIVGSGELIATTTLGAQVGFAALWLIIISCLIKVILQAELGRYTISSGEALLRTLARIPGPRWIVSWVLWCWVLMMLAWLVQIGGIVGGVGQALNLLLPLLTDRVWVFAVAIVTALYLLRGGYEPVERGATFMVVGFTFATVACAVALQWTPYRVNPGDLLEGLRFHLPRGGLEVAVAMFGITGVGSTELVMYPYWCIEKGYARFSGPRRRSPEWAGRARGWIRVMQVDVVASMVIYTLSTVAFFVLGAGVLHRSGTVPQGFGLVESLSTMYTESLGPWAYTLFVIGAFFVLYSTYFVSIASNSRLIADAIGSFGVWEATDFRARTLWVRRLIVTLSALAAIIYYFVASPLIMVVIGGIMQALMLPILAGVTLYLRYVEVDRQILPSRISDVLLWVCALLIATLVLLSLVYRFAL